MEDAKFIGNYKVLRKIGAGGMAKVYLAVHKEIPNLKVILKILSEPRLAERFKQEADKLALLDGNPNICRIKHFFTHGDDTVIAMEFIDGASLEDRLKETSKLPTSEATSIIADMLETLHFAHERGVSHRDIKPSNVMVETTGRVKIIDFGIAKGESDPNLTIAGTACGTPAYMAPEQFTPSDDTDYRLADVYATGITLYKLLTGKLPFSGDNEFALRDAKMFNDPIDPAKHNPEISPDLARLVLKAISREPQDRFASAAEMREALLSLQGVKSTLNQPTQAVSTKAKPSRAGRPTSSGGKRKLSTPIIAVGVLVVLAVAWFGYQFLSPDGPDLPPSPQLALPPDGAVIEADGPPHLEWTATDAVRSCILEYAEDSAFTDSKTIAGLTGGEFTFPAMLAAGTYYWRIHPVGEGGVRGEPSPTSYFEIREGGTATGQLSLAINPEGNVYVDGELIVSDRSEISLDLPVGDHALRVENVRSTQRRFDESVTIEAGQTVERSFRFTFGSAPSGPKHGEIRIGSRPRGATVAIDGQRKDQLTPYTFRVRTGQHIVVGEIEIEGEMKRLVDTVRVQADSSHKVMFEF